MWVITPNPGSQVANGAVILFVTLRLKDATHHLRKRSRSGGVMRNVRKITSAAVSMGIVRVKDDFQSTPSGFHI